MLRCLKVMSAVACGLLLSACGPQLMPLSDVQQLKAADGSYGQDIYGFRRAQGENVPNMRGNQVVEIRTFTAKTNDFGNEVADQEIAGAECVVIAEDSQAKIRTPGALHVPLYGYRSPDMTVQCIKPGFQDAVNAIGKYNLTQAQRSQAISNAAASGGIIGALVGVAVNVAVAAANDPTDDDYNYIAPRLLLRPGQGSGSLPSASDAQTGTPAEAPAAQTPATAAPAAATPAVDPNPKPQSSATRQSATTTATVETRPSTTDETDTYGHVAGLSDNPTEAELKCRPYCQ